MPIRRHPCDIPLEENATLWRYMSFSKYESLLKDQALFFCRADKFPDPYECSIPKRESEFRTSPAKFHSEELVFGRTASKFDPERAKNNSDATAATHKRFRTATTVNCWHINDNESDAMWQLYLKDNEGIAIRTNKNKLYEALDGAKENIGVSKVRYINYDKDIWYHPTEFPVEGYNFYTPIIHKKIEFYHEKELRLYHHLTEREKDGYWDTQENSRGELIKINVPTLVESIIFHPTADNATREKIVQLAKAYNFDFKFADSRLSVDPIY